MGPVGLYVAGAKGVATLQAAIASEVPVAYVVTEAVPGVNDRHEQAMIENLAASAWIPIGGHVEVAADRSIAAGWRRMLDVPNLVVIHDSLLPRYRGFAPLVTALIDGAPRVGATAILGGPIADTGPIVGQYATSVVYPARIADVIAQVAPLYARLTRDILANWPTAGTVQNEVDATYSVWRDGDDYVIDWSQDSARILRLIDAVSDPYPGASTSTRTEVVRVLEADELPDVRVDDRKPGKVIFLDGGCPVVVCGRGLLRLLDLRDYDGRSLLPWLSLRTRFA